MLQSFPTSLTTSHAQKRCAHFTMRSAHPGAEEPATSSELGAVPDFFLCPLTCRLLQHPVVAADGVTYERAAIERHFATGGGGGAGSGAICLSCDSHKALCFLPLMF